MHISAIELLKRIRYKRAEERAGLTPEEEEEQINAAAERYDLRAEERRAELAKETAGMTAEEVSAYINAKSQAGWEALVKETEGMTEDDAYAYLIAKGEKERDEWWARHQATKNAGGSEAAQP